MICIKKSRDVAKEYNAAIESMDAADSNSLDDTLNAGENFYDTYTPLFRKYLEGEPERKVVECRTESSGVTVSGSTVFKNRLSCLCDIRRTYESNRI